MLIIPSSLLATFGYLTKGCLTLQAYCHLCNVSQTRVLKTVTSTNPYLDSQYSLHSLVLYVKYFKQQVVISSVVLNTHCASRVDLIRQAIQSSRGHQSSSDGKSNKSFEGLKVIYGQNVRRNEQK